MGDAYKILDGLAHCLPETEVDSMMECITCPYYSACKDGLDHSGVILPIELIEDIRMYIKRTIGKTFLQ